MSDKPKIYCFMNGGSPGWYDVIALAEDGTDLAGHICSSPAFFHHDIGITSDWKHDKYREHYPDGYELVWIERQDIIDGKIPMGLKLALAIGEQKAAQR